MTENGDPHLLADDLLPTPFTADEIRGALRGGAAIRMRVEAPDGTVTERISRYSAGDDEGTLLETHPVGTPEAAVGRRVTWHELQAHAAFPVDRATVTTETLTHPLGQLECRRYDVNDDDGVAVFWFALAYPGMPVRYETTDAVGTTRVTVQEVRHPRPAFLPPR
ncbi:hypothetical protein [Microbacterium mangrovi]|uniref:hypothetical protein n=1 Tax=Microbacterium mangrovi TaxID=1348253 RepID=UPI0006907FD2|nr:hypothetical protein [Microbacterium mangrovi]